MSRARAIGIETPQLELKAHVLTRPSSSARRPHTQQPVALGIVARACGSAPCESAPHSVAAVCLPMPLGGANHNRMTPACVGAPRES